MSGALLMLRLWSSGKLDPQESCDEQSSAVMMEQCGYRQMAADAVLTASFIPVNKCVSDGDKVFTAVSSFSAVRIALYIHVDFM